MLFGGRAYVKKEVIRFVWRWLVKVGSRRWYKQFWSHKIRMKGIDFWRED